MASGNIVEKIDLDKISEKTSIAEQVEKPVSLEQAQEAPLERRSGLENLKEVKTKNNQENVNIVPPVNVGQALSFQKQRALEIDNILSEGLHEIFLQMKPAEQKAFKLLGEETALKISLMFDKGKVKISKVIELIRKWLKLIPGVNKFFLEQETKIKADKIMRLKNK